MTRVYAERAGERCVLTAEGHATGSEQVCAAVSGLLFALAGYLVNAEREGRAKLREMVMEDGRARFDFDCDDHAAEAFKITVIGLKQLSESYGEYIKTEYFEK